MAVTTGQPSLPTAASVTTLQTAVEVLDVSKRFRLYKEKYQSVKERVLHAGRNAHSEFWALRDVRFDVIEGETVGILGRNGSGKSTLLKCVTGVLQPTAGQVRVRGKLAALLELGAGFQPELSGRDNVYLNAALLGLSQRETEARFDEIVGFAELEAFIDNQVKFYSSGMYVRLGFAIAVCVEPEVLVIDEVLAVGDENFQRKCLERINRFQREGRTILFVSHSSDLVRQVCDRAVVLAGGEVIGIGTAGEAIRTYREFLLTEGGAGGLEAPEDERAAQAPAAAYKKIMVTSVDLEHPGSGSRPYLMTGEPMKVRMRYEAHEPVDDVVFAVAIYDKEGGLVFGITTEHLGIDFAARPGSGVVEFDYPHVNLLDGTFQVNCGIQNRGTVIYDWREQAAVFEVMNPGRAMGNFSLDVDAEIRPDGGAAVHA